MAGEEAGSAHTPPADMVLAYAAMVPILAGAGIVVIAWPAPLVLRLLVLWAGSILCFLGGVRRGTAFYTPGGASLGEQATMLWIFGTGVAAVVTPAAWAALLVLVVGYASVAVLDRRAARQSVAPLFFAGLRPPQMLVAVVSLAAALLRVLVG